MRRWRYLDLAKDVGLAEGTVQNICCGTSTSRRGRAKIEATLGVPIWPPHVAAPYRRSTSDSRILFLAQLAKEFRRTEAHITRLLNGEKNSPMRGHLLYRQRELIELANAARSSAAPPGKLNLSAARKTAGLHGMSVENPASERNRGPGSPASFPRPAAHH